MAMAQNNKASLSRLEIYDIRKGSRETIYEHKKHFEAPNWSPDGSFLLFNSAGRLYKMDLNGRKPEVMNTGFARQCNNDHGISPDGSFILLSNNDLERKTGPSTGGTSRIYQLPVDGGEPKILTPIAASYWHGISPDGKVIAYTASRNGEFDIYITHLNDNEWHDEIRLTDAPGLDDGPDYSPDGRYIYYNSYRNGSMEIWRMDADGSYKTQLTNDEYSNWFPHPSPDGKHLVFISYLEDQGYAHPPMKDVMLRLMDLETGEIERLCSFTGGQGTINVPSWSPDGKRFAFVSYEF